MLGHYLVGQGCKSERVLRRRGWEFPELSVCRKAWEKRFPGWEWRDPSAWSGVKSKRTPSWGKRSAAWGSKAARRNRSNNKWLSEMCRLWRL